MTLAVHGGRVNGGDTTVNSGHQRFLNGAVVDAGPHGFAGLPGAHDNGGNGGRMGAISVGLQSIPQIDPDVAARRSR